jgi:hypothetical protein
MERHGSLEDCFFRIFWLRRAAAGNRIHLLDLRQPAYNGNQILGIC